MSDSCLTGTVHRRKYIQVDISTVLATSGLIRGNITWRRRLGDQITFFTSCREKITTTERSGPAQIGDDF
jgi:hypothetical protein